MKVEHLNRNDVDENLWDDCISHSPNGTVQCFTWFLDIVCEEWEALIVDDYDTVLPLPMEYKSGIKVVITPYWIPHLGIITKKPITEKQTLSLLNHIPYKNINLTLNAHNKLPGKAHKKSGFISYCALDLISNIDRIKKNFDPELKSVLEYYNNKKITVARSTNPNEYLNFSTSHSRTPVKHLKTLIKLISFSLRYKSAGLYAAYDKYNEEMAQAFLIKSNNTLSLLHYTSHKEDKMHMGIKSIIFHILKNNAESNLTMEFPYQSSKVGKHFCKTEHHCFKYKKGWMNYLVSARKLR